LPAPSPHKKSIMGAGCSLPDGSELKGPEERVAHEVAVRANVALVFVKPHACTPECVDFVRSALLKVPGIHLLGECPIAGPAIKERGLVDKHYAAIAKHALETPPAELCVTAAKRRAFEQAFGGLSWTAALERGEVFNAADGALKLAGDSADEPIAAKDLFAQWQRADPKVKLAPGAYVARLSGNGSGTGSSKGGGGDDPGDDPGDDDDDPPGGDDDGASGTTPNVFVVDGFYPYLREKFVKDEAALRLFVVAFDPRDLSWAAFREEVIGATNPAKAAAGSLRAEILAKWEALGLSDAPDTTDNGVHGSAGPLEALRERLIWLDLPLDKDPTGLHLTELAVWDEAKRGVLEHLFEDPMLELPDGRTGSAFDLTEDVDTPDLYVLANNVAFKDALALDADDGALAA